jgi:hypothetical protein
MRHLKIYESYVNESGSMTDMDVLAPGMDLMNPKTGMSDTGTFETESTDFITTKENEEGDYIVKFSNAEGEEVTVTIGHAIDPEYMGKKMVSAIEMIPDSSSDGREYSFVGYYEEIPGSAGAYELTKVLIEG